MGFRWNNIHTNDIGIYAEARTLPILPEPIIITEELTGRDGFYDFSTFNNDGRAHHKPREWEYRCSLDTRLKNDIRKRVEAITRLFSSYSGYLEDDNCPGVRWPGVITNKLNLTAVARTLHEFAVYFRTQAFAEGLTPVTVTLAINADTTVTVSNPGTWYARPDVYLTGTVATGGARLGDMPVHYIGKLDNEPADGPELAPGDNAVRITGFTGTARFVFTPFYVWGLPE